MASINCLPQELLDKIFALTIQTYGDLILLPTHALQNHRRPHNNQRQDKKYSILLLSTDKHAIETFLGLRMVNSAMAKRSQQYFYKHTAFEMVITRERHTLSHHPALQALIPQVQHLRLIFPKLEWGIQPHVYDDRWPDRLVFEANLRWSGWECTILPSIQRYNSAATQHVQACRAAFCASLKTRLDTYGMEAETVASAKDQVRRFLWAIHQGTEVGAWDVDRCLEVAAMREAPKSLTRSSPRRTAWKHGKLRKLLERLMGRWRSGSSGRNAGTKM